LTGCLEAQAATGTDHIVVIELGGAAEWPLEGEQPNYGGTLAAEATPIEHWLEVEAGATLLGTSRRREIAADFIVKKPFEISSTVELMTGVGPELSWQLTRGSSGAESGNGMRARPHGLAHEKCRVVSRADV